MEGGTGVFYQVMPAVGPDGKNVMKLIPVPTVNGQFMQLQPATKKDVSEAATLLARPIHITPVSSQNRIPFLQPTTEGRLILKGPTDINANFVSHQVTSNATKALPVRVQLPIVTPKMTQNVVPLPLMNHGQAAMLPRHHVPIVVKPTVLPPGHRVQVTPTANVQMRATSTVPSPVKRQLVSAPCGMASPSKLSKVLYVSPVKPLKLDTPKLATPAPCPKQGQLTKTATISAVTPPQTNASIGPVKPMKWVVEETAGLKAPCIVPASFMASDILKVAAQMAKDDSNLQMSNKLPSPRDRTEMLENSKDNSGLVSNSGILVVTQKPSDGAQKLSKMVTNGLNAQKQMASCNSLSGLCQANGAKSNSNYIQIDDVPDDVIDLCDDDPTCNSISRVQSKGRRSGAVEDEDSNVIFVSYIPPQPNNDPNTKEATTLPANANNTVSTGVAQKLVRGSGNPNRSGGCPISKPLQIINIKSLRVMEGGDSAAGVTTLNSKESGTNPVSVRVDLKETTSEKQTRESDGQVLETQTKKDCTITGQLQSNKDIISIQSITNQDNILQPLADDDGVNGVQALEASASSTTAVEIIKQNQDKCTKPTRNDTDFCQKPECGQITSTVTEEPNAKEDPPPFWGTCDQTSLNMKVTPQSPENTSIMAPRDQNKYDWEMRHMFGITSDIKVSLTKMGPRKPATPANPGSVYKSALERIRQNMQISEIGQQVRRLIKAQVPSVRKDACPIHAKRKKLESLGGAQDPAISTIQSQTCHQQADPHEQDPKHQQEVHSDLLINVKTSSDLSCQDSRNNSKEPCDSIEEHLPDDNHNETHSFPLNVIEKIDEECPTSASKTEVARMSMDLSSNHTSEYESTNLLTGGQESTEMDIEFLQTVEKEGEEETTKELSPQLMDLEEIKRSEKIKRLKELLKEKEAAIETIRNKC
ncbi:uncharacterized protein lrif1 [Denticeps clupeoides]|uniref:uncharacterized protein lrif1 n=1 Tax=Denticeps clupeoides TaxID=299321 RepID=UPI0010A2FB59|nr:ligand-dependent nuclear receptor-interacting factor 1 [Denticeps clupeoides]